MAKYIKVSKTNKYFIYLLLSSILDFAKDSLYGLNHNESFKIVKLYNDEVQNELSKHKLMHYFFNYIGTIVLAYIFYKIEIYNSRGESSLITSNKKRSPILLIHNNNDNNDFKSKKSFIFFLLIIIIWILEELLIKIHIEILQDLDFWMIEILIISFLTSKMFHIEIFRHQILAMSINIIPCLLKIGSIILSFQDNSDDKNNYTGKLPVLYIKNSYIIIPIGITIYLFLITLRSIVNSHLKWYMELQNISSKKLLIFYGTFGAIICSFICLISTFNECKTITNIKQGNKDVFFADYICKVKYNKNFSSYLYNSKNNTGINSLVANNATIIYLFNSTYYFDNFLLYFNKFKGIEILKELSIIILGIITFFFNKYFSILVIKYLTPVHITFSIPIIYIIQKLAMFLNTLIWTHKPFVTDNLYKHIKCLLDIVGDMFSVLGFLIYLEIIVLNFCKCENNVKKNIIKRCFKESYGINRNIVNESQIENDKEDKSFSSEDVDCENETPDLLIN